MATVKGKSPVKESVNLNELFEYCHKFSEKEINEREYLGMDEMKMELHDYFEPNKRTISFINYLRNNEEHSLNFFVKQNGDSPHYTYHIGQRRERKEYNRIEIISFPKEDYDSDRSESIKSEGSEAKRRRKGKGKLYKEDEALPEQQQKRRTSRKLIDLFKDSPVNMDFLVKLSKRIDRKQRKKEKETKKDEERKNEDDEERKKEDDEEYETPLRRSRKKQHSREEGQSREEGHVGSIQGEVGVSLEKEEIKEEQEDIRSARSPIRRQLAKERRRRHRSHPIEARSIGVLQLPTRSLSDLERERTGSNHSFSEAEYEGTDDFSMDLSHFPSKKGSTIQKDIVPFQHNEAENKGEIEEVSSDNTINIYKRDIKNPQAWDWERLGNLDYQADSSSPHNSPNKDYQQPSASCEIIEEEEEEGKKEGKVPSPKEDYIENIEEDKGKKSKNLKEKMAKKFRKVTASSALNSRKISEIKRAISDKIKRRIKST
uniref:ANK_REP_REGION domain-containing protein n=1 Tax=Meloidogyne hapla TaxID=6305 RepID=A0A1I8BW96_MELHA